MMEWERLKVQNEWVKKWNGAQPSVQLGSSGVQPLLSLPASR